MIVDKIKKRETKSIRPSNKVDIQVGKWVKCENIILWLVGRVII